jgi:hypothetical protein
MTIDDNADAVSFDLINAPTGMTVDKQTGVVVWKPTAVQIDAYYADILAEQQRLTGGRASSARTTADFNLLLRASDGKGGQSLQALKLQLVSNNTAPVFTSTPPTINPQTGKVFKYQATAIDAQPLDVLTYSLVGSVAGVAINTPPQIQSTPNTVGGVSSPYKYQVKAVDGEGDVLTYTLGRRPVGMMVNGNTGLVSWTPNSAQVGTQTIDVFVTDAQGAVTTQTYHLVVGTTPINQPPTITSTPKFTADTSTQYQYQVVAVDPDSQLSTLNSLLLLML